MRRPAAALGLDRLGARDRRALAWGLALVGPMLLWVAGVRPYRAALAEVGDRVVAERALLARERGLLESEAALRGAHAAMRTEAERAERRLVVAGNAALAEAELTDYLEVAAVESRVLLEEIRSMAPPQEMEAPQGMDPLRLSVRGESDLEGVMTFLRALETSPLLLRVHGLSVEPAPSEEGAPAAGVLELTVVLEGWTWSTGAPGQEESER